MINLEGIKNIIFDFGNVICDIDFNRTVDAFSRLSNKPLSITVEDYIHHPVFGGLEKGDITTAQFRNEIRQLLHSNASDEAIDNAWAQVIVNSDKQRIDMLKILKNDFRIFLLSNTNEIHVATAFHRIGDCFEVDFENLFEKVYFSHLIGMAKPNADIYNYVLKDAGILSSETLFIDDNKDNIIAAQHLGFKVYHYNPYQENLVNLFFENKFQ